MKKIWLCLLAIVCFATTTSAQLLYRVTGNDLRKPSYIMGTYHLANVQFVDSVVGLRKALKSCEQVYGELSYKDVLTNASVIDKMQQASSLPEGETISKLLTAEQFSRLNKLMRELLGTDLTNPQMSSLNQMKPAVINTMLQAFINMKENGGVPNEEHVQFDAYFQSYAMSKHKKVDGLETIDQQIKILYGDPIERQIEKLMCTVDNVDYNKEVTRRIIAAFYKQDLDELNRISQEKQHNACDITPAEEEELIFSRNANWAKLLPAIMREKSTLFAVGCLHLPGEKGLLNLLKQAGYTISPVK